MDSRVLDAQLALICRCNMKLRALSYFAKGFPPETSEFQRRGIVIECAIGSENEHGSHGQYQRQDCHRGTQS